MIEIKNGIKISEEEIFFSASRSSGPGGQNVNKVNSRVTIFFDVANSPHFSEDQKQLILRKLATRINKEGVMRVVSQKYRSQRANRDAAMQKLIELLRGALERKPRRKKTRLPERARQKRLDDKKQRGTLKKLRSKELSTDE